MADDPKYPPGFKPDTDTLPLPKGFVPEGSVKKKGVLSLGGSIASGYGGTVGSSNGLSKQEKEDERTRQLLSTIKPSDYVAPKTQITTSQQTSIIDDPVKHLLTPFRSNAKKASSELEKYGSQGRQVGESTKQANLGDRTQINTQADFQAKLKQDNNHAQNQLVDVANAAYNTFMPNGKKAQEYLQEKFVENNGKLPENNETVNLAINKANRYEEIRKRVLAHPDLTQLAVDIARGDNPHLDKQIGVLEKESGWDGDMNTTDEAMKQRVKESIQSQRGTGKYVYENIIPENQQGFYVDQLIHDPDISVIAEDNPGLKAQLDYLKNGGVYERYGDYGENVARNILSREYEHNKANIIANPIFNKSEYLDKLSDKTFADNPALKKIADERLKGKWEGKIDTPGIVDEFGTGAKHTYQGMAGTFKDLIGAGDTESERIYKGLEDQHGQVSSGVTGWKKDIGTASNFLGMMSAMATGGVPLKAAGLTPAAINAVVTAGTFYDDELNNWTMKYPGEQWKAQAGATLSTAAYAAVAKAFPHTKMADAIAGKMQPSIVEALLKLDEGVVSAEVRNNLVQKYANVLSETAKGTIEGTAHMVTVTAFQDALDRALGLDERESQGTDIMDVAKNMIIGGLFPQFIGAYGNRNAVGRGLSSIADYPTRHMDVLEKMKENGTITEAEFNKKAEDIAFLNKIKSEIPEGITDKNKGRFLVEALNEKHIKEAASKLPDANLTRRHTEQIRTAQEVKDRILNGEDVAAEDVSGSPEQELIKTALANNEITGMYKDMAEAAMKNPKDAKEFIDAAHSQINTEVAGDLGDSGNGSRKAFGKTISESASQPLDQVREVDNGMTPPEDIPLTIKENKDWNEISLDEKRKLATENLPEVTDGKTEQEIIDLANDNAKFLLGKLRGEDISKPIELDPRLPEDIAKEQSLSKPSTPKTDNVGGDVGVLEDGNGNVMGKGESKIIEVSADGKKVKVDNVNGWHPIENFKVDRVKSTSNKLENLSEKDFDKLTPSQKVALYKEHGITKEDGSPITEKDIENSPLQYSYDFMASSDSGKWNSANSELESAVQGNRKQYALYKLMNGEFDTFKEFVDFINSKNYGDKIEYTDRMKRADDMSPAERKAAVDSYNKSVEDKVGDKSQKEKDILDEHGLKDETEYSPHELVEKFPLKGVQKVIWDIISPIVKKLGIKVKFSSSRITEGFDGSSNPMNGEVLLRPSTLKNGRLGEVLVHEVVHSLTTKIISRVNSGVEIGLTSKQVAAVKGLGKLYKSIEADNNLQNKYPVKDIFEFIAHLTNDSFVKELESKDRNFIQKVVDFISDILGLTNANELAKKYLKDIIHDGTFLEKEGITVVSSDYAANVKGAEGLTPKQRLLEAIKNNSKTTAEKYHDLKSKGKENDFTKAVEQSLKETTKAETPTPKGNTSNEGVEEGSGGVVDVVKEPMGDNELQQIVGRDVFKQIQRSEEQLGEGVVDRNRMIETAKRIQKADKKDKLLPEHIFEALQYETGFPDNWQDLRNAIKKGGIDINSEAIQRQIEVGVSLPKDIVEEFKKSERYKKATPELVKAVEQSLSKPSTPKTDNVGGESKIAKRIRDNIKDLPEKDLGDEEANKNWNDIRESRKKIKSMSDEELLKEVQKGMNGKKINQAIYESYFGMDITAKDIEAELQSLSQPSTPTVQEGKVEQKTENNGTQKANEEGGGSDQPGKQQATQTGEPIEPVKTEGEGTEPPPGKPTTPEENAGGITHAAVAEARKKAGLPDYEGHTPVTHEERISKAREDIAANPSLPDETMKYVERGGRLTPQDNAVLAVYKKSLDAELESNPTKETYDKVSRIAKVLDPEGTYAGQLLESRKLIDFNEDNLANFLMGKETAQSAPLTDKQVKDETAKFTELKKERDQLAKDLAAEKEAHQKLIAEVGLNKAKAIAKKASKKTREEHIADRRAIVEKAREALKKIRQDQSLKSTVPGFAELKALAPHVKEFMQDLLNEGIDKFDNIVTDIHAEFKDVLDGLRKSDIVDILAGDYNEKKQTKNEKAAQLHLIKREAQLLKELAEARKGSESAKSETVRTEKDRRIAELEKKIKEVRDLNKKPEEPVDDSSPFEFSEDEVANQKEQEKLQRQIDKLEDDLKNKKYAPEPEVKPVLKMSRKTILQKDKVIALENKIRIERAKDEYAKKSKFLKAWDKVMQVLGVKRIVQTAVDVSIPFRQGATLLGPRRFGTWVKSFGKMWQAIFNQKKYDRMMYDIRHSEDYHDMTKDGIVFNELESINPENRNEDFQKSFAYKIPIVREPLLASNRAADAFLNIARYELYEKLKANLERQGITRQSDPKAYEFVANWAMNMTGRGKMHSSLEKPEMRMVLGNTFYGARLMASRMNLLNPLTYFDPKIPKEVRYEAMKDMVSFIGTTLAVGYGLSQITGAKISLNPWDSDFLQLRYGNKVYDISGGLANYIRTGLRMIDAAKSKFDGSTKYEQKEKVQKAGMSSLNFFRNKLAPNTAYATDWFFGKANGQDFDASEIYKIYPMYADDVYKAMKEDGLISLATVLLPNLLGVGYGNYASRGQVDPDIDTLLERNMRSDELDKSTIHNYNDGGREINNKEFKTYIDKRDAEIKAGIEELYNKGKKIVGDDYKVKYKPYLDMTKDEVVKETNAIKSKATSKIKKELFGEKPDKTIQEEIKDEILDLDKLKKN